MPAFHLQIHGQKPISTNSRLTFLPMFLFLILQRLIDLSCNFEIIIKSQMYIIITKNRFDISVAAIIVLIS